jgi:hypothetical protein
MKAISLWWFAMYLMPLLEDRPPAQVFVHITIRIVVLGSLVGLIFVGRKLVQRWQKRTGGNQEDIE